MRLETSDAINKIGLENVANTLHVTPKRLMDMINHPEKFKLRDLVALQEQGFTDKMILLILDKLKREEN
jgi:hypothetical protein